MMEEKVLLFYSTLLLASTYFLFNRRRRRYAVRPMNRNRKKFGHYENLVKFMKNHDEDQFFKYCRMTPAMFDHLAKLIKNRISKDITKNPLVLEQRLAMTLHYLSEGCSMQEIAWGYYVGKSTVHCVIKETCDALWEQLSPIYLKEPTVTEWSNIADGFYNRWNMPNCIGALDGKHVLIQSPKHSGSNFFNYKHSFSIVLMATCDAFYRFTLVDIGGPGSNHDSSVFKKAVFGEALLENQLVIPEKKNLPGTSYELPHFFVADQAFPLHNNIMRPYPGERLSEKKNIFNLRLSRARRCIENTFGILAQRWRILRKPIIADVTMCDKIVKAAVVLHNYVQSEEIDIPISERRYCPTGFADYVDVTGQLHVGHWADEEPGLRSVGRVGANNASRSVLQNRDKLADFFVSNNGYVPWQWDQVNRGRIPLN